MSQEYDSFVKSVKEVTNTMTEVYIVNSCSCGMIPKELFNKFYWQLETA